MKKKERRGRREREKGEEREKGKERERERKREREKERKREREKERKREREKESVPFNAEMVRETWGEERRVPRERWIDPSANAHPDLLVVRKGEGEEGRERYDQIKKETHTHLFVNSHTHAHTHTYRYTPTPDRNVLVLFDCREERGNETPYIGREKKERRERERERDERESVRCII